jgi:UDP:flavonoid glycosyltransferase YjiC (YdhE family)
MRILFSALRMTGHLRPLFPYARALDKRGHDVLFAAPESARQIVEAEGLNFLAVAHPGDDVLKPVWKRAGSLPLEWANALFLGDVFAGLNARAALPELREAMRQWKPDLVLRESAEFAAPVAAAEAGIPTAQIALNNDVAEEWIFDHAKAKVDLLRLSVGLEADDGAALRAAPVFTCFPHALTASVPVVQERRPFRVRTDRHSLTRGDKAPSWAPQGGESLIFVSLGTLPNGQSKGAEIYRAVVQAASTLPAQFLLSTGSAALESGALGDVPDNVTVENWVAPQDIYPRATALLCHGGSGTLLEGLAAGLPLVLTPLGGDQLDNARLVEDAGAGITLLEPDPSSLANALARALNDQGLRARARDISDEIAALPGIDAAVDALLASV